MMFLGQGSAKAHVPDVTNEKTFVDFLVVCCLGVLLNVLCHMTYSAAELDERCVMDDTQVYLWDTCDINGLSEDERKQLCLARGQSIELILWLSTTYSTGIHDTPVQKLYARVLVNICKMLCNYKWKADNGRPLPRRILPSNGSKYKFTQSYNWLLRRWLYLPSLTATQGNGSSP